MIGRALSGIGIGISSALVPLYISEVALYSYIFQCSNVMSVFPLIFWYVSMLYTWQISPTEIRGALGSVNQLFICIGILAALIAGLPLSGNPLWYNETILFFTV